MAISQNPKSKQLRRNHPKHRTEKKEEILAVAAELFAEHGYSGVSVIDIAKTAGLSKSALYHYYEHKEQILATIVVTTIRDLNKFIAENVPDDLPPAARFKAFMEEQAEFFERNQTMFKVLLTQLGNLTDLKLRDAATEWRIKYENFIRSIIQDGVRDGSFHPGSVETVVRAAMASMYWLVRWYRTDGSKLAREINGEYADLLLFGVTSRD